MEKLVSGVADRVQDPYRIDSIGPWHVKSCVNSGLRCESPSNITALLASPLTKEHAHTSSLDSTAREYGTSGSRLRLLSYKGSSVPGFVEASSELRATNDKEVWFLVEPPLAFVFCFQ